ncbi:MAG: esterase [Bacteroidales bacterium]|nr:esterase [Bacteroidales bacterium]
MFRRILLSVVFLLATVSLFAQTERTQPEPTINQDNTVTFHFAAPTADSVFVDGDFLPDNKRHQKMQRGENGVWVYITEKPLEPEIYTYSYFINGNRVEDPYNIFVWRNCASFYNIFIINGERTRNYVNKDVPHGSVAKVWYPSASFSNSRRMSIYTPPGYNPRGSKKYPVFYLLHGAGQDEDSWLGFGRMAQIMDNLIREGKVKPMIVVMPNGNVSQQSAPLEGSDSYILPTFFPPRTMNGEFEASFNEIISFVESNYRVKKSKDSRAIGGLSMGGFHSIYISANNPKLFGYVGLFSPVLDPSIAQPANKTGFELSEIYINFEQKLKTQFEKAPLYWIGVGDKDPYKPQVDKLRTLLNNNNLQYSYNETSGGHVWTNWRIYLEEFLPLLFQ